jgi:hypothetical protein
VAFADALGMPAKGRRAAVSLPFSLGQPRCVSLCGFKLESGLRVFTRASSLWRRRERLAVAVGTSPGPEARGARLRPAQGLSRRAQRRLQSFGALRKTPVARGEGGDVAAQVIMPFFF